jgi:WXG100 family type VII secretion target
MADEIRADYNQLTQIANRFTRQAAAMRSMQQKVQRSMNPLKAGGWVGLGSDAFFGEMEGKVLPGVKNLVNALDEAARVTKQMAQELKQAEEEAANPFRTQGS